MNWLRNKIDNWLGLTSMRCELNQTSNTLKRMEQTWEYATTEIQDVSIRGNTRIVIASNLGQGYCRTYELKMGDVRELMDFCEMLRHREVSSQTPFINAEFELQDRLRHDRRSRGMPSFR